VHGAAVERLQQRSLKGVVAQHIHRYALNKMVPV
jgi:hypothetical protein